MKNGVVRRGGAAVIVLMSTIWLSGCKERNQFVAPPPPDVTVAIPVQQDVVDSVEFTGTTRATARVDLRARVNGYLHRIEFDDGQIVQKGDLLFAIEPDRFEASLQAAEAGQQKAQAALQLADASLARVRQLISRDVATQQELDVQEAERATAVADVAAAAAEVRRATLELSYTNVHAPISGRIGRKLVDPGNLVQAELTLLATIESIDPIHAYFYLSEQELLRFMEMLREKKLPDPETSPPVLQLGLSNESGFPHEGLLDYREFGIDPSTGTITRRGIFPNPDGALIPGLFVRIRASIGQPLPRLLVEERALGSDQRGDFLLIVNEENTVEYRLVKLGIAVRGLRVVESGLKPEDRVVVNGLQRARPGSKVNPKLGEMETFVEEEGSTEDKVEEPDTGQDTRPPAASRNEAG